MAPKERDELSPVIRGLRIGGDEVQFARVLADVCGGSTHCARRFVKAVLNAAKADVPVRGTVHCRHESGVVGYGRGTIHKQAKKLGSVDLLFTDQRGLRLFCELKINDSYQPDQIPKYLAGGQASHVVSVVRRPMLKEGAGAGPRWLGEVTWGQIEEDLRNLPIRKPNVRTQWLDLLALMEKQGDFATGAPTDAADEDIEFINAVASRALRHLKSKLRAESDEGAALLAHDLITGEPFPSHQGRWACMEVQDREEPPNPYFTLSVRQVESGTGVLRVRWHPWDSPASLVKKQAAGHDKLTAHPDFDKVGGRTRPGYRFVRSIGGGSYKKKLTTATAYAKEAVDAVFTAGLLQYDIEQYVTDD